MVTPEEDLVMSEEDHWEIILEEDPWEDPWEMSEVLKGMSRPVRTVEHRRKLSEAMRGKPQSIEHRRKISEANKGEKGYWYGKKHPMSDETRGKISISETAFGRKKGEKNYFWKGGISGVPPYCWKFNRGRKRATSGFFGDRCIACGIHVDENLIKWNGGFKVVKLSIHHIDHDKEQGCNGKPFNLVPLCHGCHGKERRDEEEYRLYINHTLQEGFNWGVWSEQEYMEKVMYDK